LHALSYLKQAKRVWVETKYDGERAQIHVEILPTGGSKITIFSKSKRNSTQDRKAIHETIQRAVGISGAQPTERFKCNIVLDAEMVACHGESIDGKYKLLFDKYINSFIRQNFGEFVIYSQMKGPSESLTAVWFLQY